MKTFLIKLVRVHMVIRKIVGISLDNKILDSLDRERGLIPRSRYIEKLIVDSMEREA